MSFKFCNVCELFDRLEGLREKTLEHSVAAVHAWFDKHESSIPRHGPAAVAFLSCLFPERRVDRVFGLKEKQLEAIIKHALGLGSTRLKELQQWRDSDGPGFASAVQRVMSATDAGPRSQRNVTVEEIDETLDRMASRSPFSSIELQENVKDDDSGRIRRDDGLSKIFRQIHSSEGKWLVRIVLKTLSPIEMFRVHLRLLFC
jgi:DNA ligase 4